MGASADKPYMFLIFAKETLLNFISDLCVSKNDG